MLGLEPSTVTGLIARPSMGKTALALNIAENVAAEDKEKRVLFFSLESNVMALMRRRVSAQSYVLLSRIRSGDINDMEWGKIINAMNHLGDNLFIFDSPKFKRIEDLYAMAETMALESKLSLIVIDHIQKMTTSLKTYSRHNEISTISNKITSLAKDLKVPVLVLCQLNREAEKRVGKEKKPRLSDIRESGDIEQDFDNVIGLYRESKEAEYANVECLKGRDTGTWETVLKFNRFIQKFYDCDPRDAEYSSYQEPREKDNGLQ
jgi:replicative DNA helicase